MTIKLLALLFLFSYCAPARYSSFLLDVSPTKVFAHYLPHYRTPGVDGAYAGWNIYNQNPPDNIASSYYSLLDLYSSNDPVYLEYQLQLMKLVGIDGLCIDVGIYTDEASKLVRTLIELLIKYKMIAFPIYHDSERFYTSSGTRKNKVNDILDDMDSWLDVFVDVQLSVSGRAVLGIISTSGTKGVEEGNLDDTEKRLLPEEIKGWLNTKPNLKKPILINQLFDSNYNQIFSGMLEWIVPVDQSQATYKQVQDSRVKLIGEVENNMRELTIFYHITTVWPGYDDSKVNGWGKGGRYVAYEDELTYKYLWDSVLNISSPIVVIDSWNNWWNGTAIEPSKEKEYKYLEITRKYTTTFKEQNVTHINLKVPELMYRMKLHTSIDVQEIGEVIRNLIEKEEYLAAEVLALYHAERLEMYTPEKSFGIALNLYLVLVLPLILISL